MKILKSVILLLVILPIMSFSQEQPFSILTSNSREIKIPGEWKQLNTSQDSGQTYLENNDGVIIAIAKNPQKAYPFFKKDKTNFENIKEFYKWDSDYRKENNFKTKKLKENSKLEYIIWKYNDGKLDNIFLFGSSEDNFLNLLVYSNLWSEDKQIKFLENLFEINK